MKIKFVFSTLFFISLFVQVINLLEVSKIIEGDNNNFFKIIYLSFLKLPTTMLEILPFAIVISTAFLYRNLISNNELISMRNLGYSIIDIFKPVGASVLIIGLFFLTIINPLSSICEKKFERETLKDFSKLYSIKIHNNEIWIKNLNENINNFIKFSRIDLKRMNVENIKIIEVENDKSKFYLAKTGTLDDKTLNLKDVKLFNMDEEKLINLENLNLQVNFNKNDIVNSISDYKLIPFYKYNKHLQSLKKFNLYSPEISFYYLYEIFKPLFLIMLSFVVMGFASKFKRNENFFKILFYSISIGFCFFIFKELLTLFTSELYISFWIAYVIMIFTTLIIGLYQSINIEVN